MIDRVLVKCEHSIGSNVTWELQEDMKRRYPNLSMEDVIPMTNRLKGDMIITSKLLGNLKCWDNDLKG